MLKPGNVKVLNYIMRNASVPDGIDEKDIIQYMRIQEREDYYEIEIRYNNTEKSIYWYFRIINAKNNGKTISGQLVGIGFDEEEGMAYSDEAASGSITVDLKNNITTVEIVFGFYRDKHHYTIVWENTKDDYEESVEREFEESLKIANADYGTCYTIGNYQLCPEQKIIREGHWFGTETKDYYGYFPDSSLQYDKETMIIFAGIAFFDKSNFGIDWQTAELLSYEDSVFTDGKYQYHINPDGKIQRMVEVEYIKPYVPYRKKEKKRYFDDKYFSNESDADGEHADTTGESAGIHSVRKALGGDYYISFYVSENTFYYAGTPVLEPFDVSNLRTIVSKSGFETDYITDGRQVVFGGQKTGRSLQIVNGKEYVSAKNWMIEGIDLDSLRVLGKNMLADKNALYYCTSYDTNVIPFDKLSGFKFLVRDVDIPE